MKAKFLLCSFIFIWGILSGAYSQDTLTVMSYNIYHAENPETTESTIQDIAGFINKVQPDFVALQEVDDRSNRLAKINGGRFFSLTDSLAKLTGVIGNFGKALNFDSGEYGIAILSRNKFESHKIDLPNPKQGEPRVMLYLEAETPSGNEFIFANTHLDHQYRENRLPQVEMINKALLKQRKPVMLAGDFNFTPDTEEYNVMKSKWVDASFEAGENSAFTYPSEDPVEKIDYIFLSTGDWRVVDFQAYKISFSDHLPIVAKVVID